jgi:hypothetical protein
MAEGVELFGAYYEDQGCILDDMSQRQVEDLEAKIADYVSDWCQAYEEDRADAQYEQWCENMRMSKKPQL